MTKIVKITELPPFEGDLEGLLTIGTDKNNESVKVPLGQMLDDRITKQQGKANAGKVMKVDENGNLVLEDMPGGGFYNLDSEHPLEDSNYTLELAVAVVSGDEKIDAKTKNGMIVTFYDGSEWKNYRYKNQYDPESPTADEEFANVDNWEEFSSGGGGGAGSGRIVLQRITPNLTAKVGDPVHLQFYFDHVDSEGESTGNSGTATVTVIRGGVAVASFARSITKGTVNLDVSNYCGIGVNTIRLVVVVDTGLVQQSAALAWTVQEVRLDLSSTLTGFTLMDEGDNLQVNYTLESGSTDSKTVACYVDGVQYATQMQSSSVSNGVFNIDTSGMAHGQHTVQLRASQGTGQSDEHGQEIMIYSNLIYAVIGVKTTAGTATIATALVDVKDGSTVFGQSEALAINCNQYETLMVKYGAWATESPVTISIADGQDVLQEASNYGTEGVFAVRILTAGQHALSLAANGTPMIAINVTAAEVDLGVEVPNGRTMYLDAVEHGHNNSDVDRDTWQNTEGGVETTTTFEDFSWSGDGWVDGALRLKGSARATINYKPLQSNTSGGMTIGFKFKVSNIEPEYDGESLISCMDATNTGFYITADGVYIVQDGNIRTQMLIAEDTEYTVQVVAWPQSGTGSYAQKNARFVYIYIDGIMSGSYKLANGTSIFQGTPVNVSLGASTATLDIYRTWAYHRALNDSEALDCDILAYDNDIDLLFAKRDRNMILNSQGGVSPDSLPDGTRIMIITGRAMSSSESREMASVLAAAHDNQKSKYFPCTEISSYIKGATDRSKNFIARNNGSDMVDGQDMSLKLRLQGTSSLAYPVKNYRIYTKKSTMYVGNNPESVFGETGTLTPGGKFSMHDDSAPVAVWCTKADYAESSGSHNTGMARMVNDTLKSVNVLTPAQRDVAHNTGEYPYEVRTTIDGEPCLLFYRETENDAPVFLGKFNFNNDKSTEAVFGFTGIPGYHDVSPLDDEDNNETEFVAQQYKQETGDSLGVDLTECWEFKNNEDPMGMFLDDDFLSTMVDPDSGETVPKWTGTFEARYPDKDDLNDLFLSGAIVPHYLSTLIAWVKSTAVTDEDTAEEAEAKLQAFRDELPLYFDVEHLCCYFAFTQMMACLDQMVKNMMMAFWYDKNADDSSPMGKVRAYMIFYDNDTILGIVNNGRLIAPYNVTRQTIQMLDAQQNPVYFYAGHDSVLWNNLQSQYATEIRNAYVKVRGYLTNAKIFDYFDVQQTDKFCERIYNLDALNKYVAPESMSESAVSPYRDLMQGSRKSHRHYFVKNRLSILDNDWRAGEFYSALNEIAFKGISAAGSAIGYTLRQDGNVEVQSDVSDDFVKNYPTLANTDTLIEKFTASAVGTIFHIYGVRQMKKLNVAEWDFDQINLGDFPFLEEFVFGSLLRTDGETANPYTKPSFISALPIGSKMPRLKRFVAQNLTSLPSADLSGCGMLEEIDLRGSKALQSIDIPEGAPVSKLMLPTVNEISGTGYANFNLVLIGLPVLDEWDNVNLEGLNIGLPVKIQSFTFRDCPNLDSMALLNTMVSALDSALQSVNITLPAGGVEGGLGVLTKLVSKWNNVSGSGSNLKIYGTYTVNEYYSTSQLAAIQSKIYGLNLIGDGTHLIDFDDLAVQVLDPNEDNYNPAVAIILHGQGLGTTLSGAFVEGGGRWFLTKTQAAAITSVQNSSPGSNTSWFANKDSVADTNNILDGDSYYFVSFDEFKYFTGLLNLADDQYHNSFCKNAAHLESVTLPPQLSTLPWAAFEGCSRLTSINIQNITKLSYQVFQGCILLNLEDISHITSIGAGSFNGCSSVTFTTINSSITTIGESYNIMNTFTNTSSIPYLHFLSPTPITGLLCNYARYHGYNTFYNTSYKIYVGDGSSAAHDDAILAAYQAASNWSGMTSYLDTWYNYLHPTV